MTRAFVLMSCVLWAAGCGAVTSEHPLAGEEDAVVDEALIGWWEPIPEKAEPGQAMQRLAVGYLPGSERGLELVTMGIDKKSKQVKVERFALYATTIEGKRYLSFTDTKEKKEYLLLRYAIDAEGILRVHWMDDVRVARQIEAKHVEGVAKKNPEYTELSAESEYTQVRLTAKPAALRTWLAKAGDAPWAKESMRLRKVVVRKPDEPKDE